jgi:hypothetical protein
MTTTTPKPPMTRDGVDGAYELVDAVGQPVRVGDRLVSIVTGSTFELLDGTPPASRSNDAVGSIDVRIPADNAPQGRVSPHPFGLKWAKIIPRD